MVGTSNLGSWVMAIKMSCAPSRLIVFPLALALVVFHHLYWLHMTNLWLTMLFFFPSLCADFIPSLGSYNQPMFAVPLSENAIPIPIFLMIFQGFFSFRIHFFVHQSWLPGWWFGTMEFYDFPFSWECYHPNWLSLIFFRGVGQPPASYIIINHH